MYLLNLIKTHIINSCACASAQARLQIQKVGWHTENTSDMRNRNYYLQSSFYFQYHERSYRTNIQKNNNQRRVQHSISFSILRQVAMKSSGIFLLVRYQRVQFFIGVQMADLYVNIPTFIVLCYANRTTLRICIDKNVTCPVRF